MIWFDGTASSEYLIGMSILILRGKFRSINALTSYVNRESMSFIYNYLQSFHLNYHPEIRLIGLQKISFKKT